MRLPALSTALLFSSSTTWASSTPCGSPTYTGFALKSSSQCRQYVYCQSGVVTSETSCPEGLLFNGGVGRGGVCTWPEMVVCDEESESESGDAVTATTTTAATTTIASQQTNNAESSSSSLPVPWKQYLDPKSNQYYYHNAETGVTTWDRPGGSSSFAASSSTSTASSSSNPNNYYCGQSRTDAATHCHPCPSGSLLDCGDVTHGCFRGIDACAANAGNGGADGADDESGAITQGSTTELDELLNKLANSQTMTTTTAEEAKHPTSNVNTSPMASPSVPSLPLVPSVNANSKAEAKPTESPTLPPWTNAPFVPYKGGKRDKTVIGYYVSVVWKCLYTCFEF